MNVKKLNIKELKKTNEMKLTLASLSVNEAAARAMVGAFCALLNPTATELADIKCALSEAVTNCIVHAYKEAVGQIYISVSIFENRYIRLTVKDKGIGIPDVKCAMQPLYTTDSTGERSGMGFCVMESFMDGVKVRSKEGVGTTVTMWKDITGEKLL